MAPPPPGPPTGRRGGPNAPQRPGGTRQPPGQPPRTPAGPPPPPGTGRQPRPDPTGRGPEGTGRGPVPGRDAEPPAARGSGIGNRLNADQPSGARLAPRPPVPGPPPRQGPQNAPGAPPGRAGANRGPASPGGVAGAASAGASRARMGADAPPADENTRMQPPAENGSVRTPRPEAVRPEAPDREGTERPGPERREDIDPASLTTELEPINEEIQKRRDVDHTLARFSAVHDELAAEERQRRDKRRKLQRFLRFLPWFSDEDDDWDSLGAEPIGEAHDDETSDPEVAEQPRKRRDRRQQIELGGKIGAIAAAALVFLATGVSWGAIRLVDDRCNNTTFHELRRPGDAKALFRAIIDGTPLPGKAGSPRGPQQAGPTGGDSGPGDGNTKKIQVLNGGSTKARVATSTADALRRQGFEVVRVDNATEQVPHTLIRYGSSGQTVAKALAATVPGATMQQDDSMGGAVVLTLGPDFDGTVSPSTSPSSAGAPQSAPSVPRDVSTVNGADASCAS
jgi:hypothetical protein